MSRASRLTMVDDLRHLARHGRIFANEAFRLELVPQVGSDRFAIEISVSPHLPRRERADADTRNGSVREWKSESRGRQGRPVPLADLRDCSSPPDELRRRVAVVVLAVL